jgi:hypothetical protein
MNIEIHSLIVRNIKTNSSVDVIVETLPNPGDTGTTTQNISECSEIYIINKTSNSEFLGSVTVMGPGESG